MRARLTLRIHNAKMLEARTRIGITVAELSKRAKVDVGTIYELQRFVLPKICTDAIVRVAMALKMPIEDIWTEEAAGQPIEAPQPVFVDYHALPAFRSLHQDRLRLPSGEDVAVESERRALLERWLGQLTEQQRKVLTLRFGLDGEGPRTLDEVAKSVGKTRERIRQIESRSFREIQEKERDARATNGEFL